MIYSIKWINRVLRPSPGISASEQTEDKKWILRVYDNGAVVVHFENKDFMPGVDPKSESWPPMEIARSAGEECMRAILDDLKRRFE